MRKALWGQALLLLLPGVCIACLVLINGCGFRQPPEDSGGDALLVEFKGGRLLESDLPREVVFGAEDMLYRMKLARVNEAIEKRFLERTARKEGVSVEEFIRRRVTSQVSIAEDDLKKEYAKFMDSMQGNPRLKKLSPKDREAKLLEMLRVKPDSSKTFQVLVVEHLRGSLSRRKERETIERMIKEAGLKVYLTGPTPPTYSIPTDGHPALGPAAARVSVVVFSNFQCPFCAQAASALKKLVNAFPGKVRLIFRNYPLPMHKNAQGAAEAAMCAYEQGRFWEYHDLLFANQKKLGAEDLKSYASHLGLDMARFKKELYSGKYLAKIKSDLEEGAKYGVRGTPAIYINGKPRRPRTGDYFSDLSLYVEEELRDGKIRDKVVKQARPGVLAECDGVTITEADLPKGAFYEQEERLYQVRQDQTKKLLETKLVELAARKQWVSPDSLYRKKIATAPFPQELKAQLETFQGYVVGNPRLMRLGEKEVMR